MEAEPKPPPPGTFNLWQLFVRPRWQASGVADVLMEAAVAEAQRRGFSRLRLWTPRDHAPGPRVLRAPRLESHSEESRVSAAESRLVARA